MVDVVRVQVAYVGVAQEALVTLELPHGATVDDAVAHSGLGLADDVGRGRLACAIFGRRVDRDRPLVEGDRVEITRPLVCDPKIARRRRAAQGG
jgi:putative ubiquitin-RnfH superfamily antitoxin RatB of RatAB toxin-antitoxin module